MFNWQFPYDDTIDNFLHAVLKLNHTVSRSSAFVTQNHLSIKGALIRTLDRRHITKRCCTLDFNAYDIILWFFLLQINGSTISSRIHTFMRISFRCIICYSRIAISLIIFRKCLIILIYSIDI